MAERTEHTWAVDGISEGIARIEEDGQRMLSIPLHQLPAGVTEGQLLRVSRSAQSGPEAMVVTIDHAGTAAALRASKATTAGAMEDSRKHDPGGDVAL